KATGGTAETIDTFFVKGSPQYNAKVRQVTNNLKEAQKLVDEYVAEKGPLTVEFQLYSGGVNWGEPQAQQWSRLKGITVKLEVIPTTTAGANLATGNFQMAASGITGSDPEAFYSTLHSTSRGNVYHYNNPTVDATLDELRSETDPKQQYELWTTLTKELLDDAPGVFWYRAVVPMVIRGGISGIERYSTGTPDFTTLWIAKT
ncbi:MAG: hypothetical protein ABWY80_02565, partial [Acidimicrobiia bacterium]